MHKQMERKDSSMKTRQTAALLAALLCIPTALTACGGGSDSSTLQIAAVGTVVDDEQLQSYAGSFTASSAALSAAGAEAEFTAYTVGSSDSDPAMYGTAVMKVTAAVSAHEIDLMICSLDEAARNARAGYYTSLSDAFTEEELAQFAEEDLLSFDMVDDDGNPTGEQTAVCGVRLSGSEALDNAMLGEEYGLFLVAGSEKEELAKEVFLEIAGE